MRAGRTWISIPVLALALVAAGLYGTLRLWGNQASGVCAASAATVTRMAPLARGELAAFDVPRTPEPAPDLAFDGPGGRMRLADFRGRSVLVNLWATWCEPCKREMPALDRLQAELGGPDFEVVAVNIDTRNLDRPRAWLAAAGIGRLAYYSDEEARVFQALRRTGDAEGMPTTLLVDAEGCRLGRMSGPAEWASPDGLALVKAAIASR